MDAAFTDALIAQVYSAAAGRLPWQTALDTVARACAAWAVQLLAVVAASPFDQDFLIPVGPLPLALLVLHDGTQHAQCDPFVIQELFGLTPAEADIGHRLSRGLGLEAADD